MGGIEPLERMPSQTECVVIAQGKSNRVPSIGLSKRQLTATGVGGNTKQLERLKMTITA